MIVIIVCNLGSFVFRVYFIFPLYLFSFDLKALLHVSVVDGLTKTNKRVPQYNTVYACSCVKGFCRSKSGGMEKFWASINFHPNCMKMIWGKKTEILTILEKSLFLYMNPSSDVHDLYCHSIFKKKKRKKNTGNDSVAWMHVCFLGGGCPLVFFILFQHSFPLFFKSEDGWMVVGLRV